MRPMRGGKRPEDVGILASNRLFASLPLQDLGRALDALDEIDLSSGTLLLDGNRPPDAAYVVLEGTAALTEHGQKRTLTAGAAFGETALVASSAAPHLIVEALTPMRVARLDPARFRALEAAHPALAARIVSSVGEELARRLAMTEASRATSELSGEPLASPSSITLATGSHRRVAPAGAPIGDLLPATTERVVAALLDHRPVSLTTPVLCDAEVAPLSLSHPEGRETFLRSVGLVLLEAGRMVAPEARIEWGPVVGSTRVIRVQHPERFEKSVLAAEMQSAAQRLIDARTPLVERTMSLSEARFAFASAGWDDAVSMLRIQRSPTIAIARCGETIAPRLGPLLPHAGAIGHIRVQPHPEGLLLDLAEHLAEARGGAHDTRIDPSIQETTFPRFGGHMAAEQREWLAAFGIANVGALNSAIITGRLDELVRACEGFHEKHIARIADTIAARRDRLRVIRIAGPSSSGKTTFIERLVVQLQIVGLHPIGLSLDDYYVDRDKTPHDVHGELDFEAVEAIDMNLLSAQVGALLKGQTIRRARFDFLTGKSLPDGGPELALGAQDILVLEGLHALNESLIVDVVPRDQSFGIFIHPATTMPFDRWNGVSTEDLRLLRRIVRDRHQRGYSAAENMARFASVRLGEQAHVFPCEPFADAVFDSSLAYEPAALKVLAERYLLEVDERHPTFPTALRLRNLLDGFVAIPSDHVPATSILREFIGGSGFRR